MKRRKNSASGSSACAWGLGFLPGSRLVMTLTTAGPCCFMSAVKSGRLALRPPAADFGCCCADAPSATAENRTATRRFLMVGNASASFTPGPRNCYIRSPTSRSCHDLPHRRARYRSARHVLLRPGFRQPPLARCCATSSPTCATRAGITPRARQARPHRASVSRSSAIERRRAERARRPTAATPSARSTGRSTSTSTLEADAEVGAQHQVADRAQRFAEVDPFPPASARKPCSRGSS